MGIDTSVTNQRGMIADSNPLPSTGGFIYDSTFRFFFHPDSLAKQYGYTNGIMTSITVGPDPINNGNYYKRTIGYDTGGQLTTESGWVKQ